MPCLAMLLVTTTERHSRRTTTILLFSTREEYAPPAVSVFIKRTLLQIVPAIDTGMPLPDDDDFFGPLQIFCPSNERPLFRNGLTNTSFGLASEEEGQGKTVYWWLWAVFRERPCARAGLDNQGRVMPKRRMQRSFAQSRISLLSHAYTQKQLIATPKQTSGAGINCCEAQTASFL